MIGGGGEAVQQEEGDRRGQNWEGNEKKVIASVCRLCYNYSVPSVVVSSTWRGTSHSTPAKPPQDVGVLTDPDPPVRTLRLGQVRQTA